MIASRARPRRGFRFAHSLYIKPLRVDRHPDLNMTQTGHRIEVLAVALKARCDYKARAHASWVRGAEDRRARIAGFVGRAYERTVSDS